MQSTDPTPDAIMHGTYRAYNKQQCRCAGCREAARARMATYRLRKFGDRPRTEINGYRAVHNRLSRVRGKASLCECAFCGEPASEWALDNESPTIERGLFDGRVFTWSENLADYRPLCVPCHRRYDSPGRDRTECSNGHDITLPGAIRARSSVGKTECVECARERVRRYRERRRAEKFTAL